MDIGSVYNNTGYTNNVSQSSNTRKTNTTAKTEQTTELSDAEKLDNFKKEIWNELDRMPRSSSINWSYQITHGAFERMMKEPEFKEDVYDERRCDSWSSSHYFLYDKDRYEAYPV